MSSDGDYSPPGETTRRRVITWDEQSIREQDKERGTRTKIAEVSTPFCYTSDADSQDESSSYYSKLDNTDLTREVINRLCEIKQAYEKKRQFAEHRKHHYNHEYHRQRFHESHDEEDDEQVNGSAREAHRSPSP